MVRYRILPHTADLRLRVFGRDYEELFRNAALGLARILHREAEKKEKFVRGFERISISGQNQEMLLVNFLNETLSLSNINKKVYPKIKILKISPTNLEVQLSGVSIDGFDEDVKAVSYHGAKIETVEKGLVIELTLDV